MANKPGWWNANEQVSGEQAWKPVHKLGDYSVGRGGSGGGVGGFANLAAAAYLGKKLGQQGRPAVKTPLKALPGASPSVTGTAVAMPPGFGTNGSRTDAFTMGQSAGQTPGQAGVGAGPGGFNLTDVRSGGNGAGSDVSTWAGGRYNGMAPGLNAPTPARLQPFRAGIGAGDTEPVTAELVSTPLKALNPSPLMLNAGPQPQAVKARRKPGIQPFGQARIDRDLSQYQT